MLVVNVKRIRGPYRRCLRAASQIPETHRFKKSFFKRKLKQKMQSNPVQRDLVELCIVVKEMADNEVTKMSLQLFPTQTLFLSTPLNSSDAHAVAVVLKGANHKLGIVWFSECQLNSESFSFIAEGIRGINGSIDELIIANNFLDPMTSPPYVQSCVRSMRSWIWRNGLVVKMSGHTDQPTLMKRTKYNINSILSTTRT